MTDPGLVSIVIPCHNYGAYLAEAIESALAQTYTSIEVVVVDDGSTDDSRAIASRYPVKLLQERQSGVSVAVNNGIRASSGAFVMRLDADDVLEPTYVAETREALESTRAGFAYTEVAYFGAASGTYPIVAFDLETLTERNYIHCSALMRRAAFEQTGGYDPRLSSARCEDWDLWLSFAERGLGGVLVPKPLLRYRQHAAASRNTLAWRSLNVLQRNLEMTARLQDNHPRLFAPRALGRRLGRLPQRVLRGDVTPQFAALLVAFYGVMLARAAGRLGRPRAPVSC